MNTRRPILIDLPLPILTPRLLLRDPRPGDGAAVNAALRESNADLRPYMPFARAPDPTVDDTEENIRQAYAKFILREDLRFHAFDRRSGEFVLSTGLHRFNFASGTFEIGYWTRTSRTRQGYTTEAANALTRYAFHQLGARRVELICNAGNEGSLAIARKLGFVREGTLCQRDAYVDPALGCLDSAIHARTSAEGLPPLDVSWS